MIEALLKITDSKELKLNSKNQENFLLKLLEGLKDSPKEAADLLKSLNVKKEDLHNILQKQGKTTEEFEEVLNLLESKESEVNEKPTDLLGILLKDEKKPQKSKKNPQNEEVISQITVTTNQPSYKKTEIIKKQLISSFEKQNITLTNQEIKEFKKIKSFKDLVAFANKKGLNITKVKISKTKQQITVTKQKTAPVKNTQIEILNLKSNLPKPKITIKTETKKTEIKSAAKTHKTQNQSPIKEIIAKTAKPESNSKPAQNPNTQNVNVQNPNVKDDFTTQTQKEHKKETHQTPELSTQQVNSIKHDIIKAKQTIKKFSSDLNEAVKDYKPPISKISIEMNPKEIGKVEVTLIHRGENLQIKINSNTAQTLNFIQTHQNELKQNLINMGYSEVNMSFNSNSQQQQQHQRQKQHYSQTQDELEEIVIEIPYTYA